MSAFHKMTFIAALLSLQLSACSTVPPEPPHIQSVETDKFSPNITITGAPMFIHLLDQTNYNWKIRTWINKKTGEVNHQLYVDIIYYYDWRHFEYATDENAKTLDLTKIDAEVGNCNSIACVFNEVVGIKLTTKQLKSYAKTGYSIKIYAKNGSSIVLQLTPVQIQLQLDAIEKNTPLKAAK